MCRMGERNGMIFKRPCVSENNYVKNLCYEHFSHFSPCPLHMHSELIFTDNCERVFFILLLLRIFLCNALIIFNDVACTALYFSAFFLTTATTAGKKRNKRKNKANERKSKLMTLN